MIINDLANIINNMIINLYSNGIKFWQIILAMLIMNFILYEIRFIVRHFSL